MFSYNKTFFFYISKINKKKRKRIIGLINIEYTRPVVAQRHKVWLQNRLVVIYLFKFIFSFYSHWCRGKARRWVPLLHPVFGGKWGNALTLGYLCLLYRVRDTAWSWFFYKYRISYLKLTFISISYNRIKAIFYNLVQQLICVYMKLRARPKQ